MLSQPRILYGIHSFTAASRLDGTPYGMLKVVSGGNIALTSEIEKLFAGSNRYAWAAENKTVDTEFTCKVKAYPNFLFELFLGATATDASNDAAGTVSTVTNVKGTSAVAAAGIASISVKAAQKANLKFGKYIIKVLTSTTIGIFLLSDIDANRGTDVVYTDDSLQLTLSTITIAAATGVDIDSLGLTITGGAGPIAMTVGDTAEFEVLPPSSKNTNIVVGRSTDTIPAFRALLLAQKRATGEMFEIFAPNCVGGGLPINLAENAFSEADLKVAILYDQSQDKVFSIRHIVPST